MRTIFCSFEIIANQVLFTVLSSSVSITDGLNSPPIEHIGQ